MNFTSDGMALTGRPGDTIASALLRAGVRVVNRSCKYHRPREIWGAWVDEPNAIVDVSLNGIRTPNCRTTTTPLVSGMKVESVNSAHTARHDPLAVLAGLPASSRRPFSTILSSGPRGTPMNR